VKTVKPVTTMSYPKFTYLEVCCDTASSAILSLSLNAPSPSSIPSNAATPSPPPMVKVELCKAVEVGGLTPSTRDVVRVMKYVTENDCVDRGFVTCLIRPIAGSFVYDVDTIEDCERDIVDIIEACKKEGVDVPGGFAVGFMSDEGEGMRVEEGWKSMKKMIDGIQEEGIVWTMHRCIDDVIRCDAMVGDVKKYVDFAKKTGFNRVLTSGGHGTAQEGRNTIKLMKEEADKLGGIDIVAASGIDAYNVEVFEGICHAVHVGSGAKKPVGNDNGSVEKLGLFGRRKEVDIVKVGIIRNAMAKGVDAETKSLREHKDKRVALESPVTREVVEGVVNSVLESYTNAMLSGKGGYVAKMAVSDADTEDIMTCVQSLAVFEKEPDAVNATVETYRRDGGLGGGERGMYFCLLVREAGEPVGMAFFYFAYSTWEGRVLYLEDLYIEEKHRGKGVGGVLMRTLAKISVRMDCKRFQWQALDWNVKAIGFYEKIGAKVLTEWVNLRIEGDKLEEYAAG
jgi:copper homeostasis protein CutC/GNAT superfamily N-acetyltransferase